MPFNENSVPLRFTVTVDTEADDAWDNPQAVALSNMRELPRFQDLCDRYDIVPTYLVTYECATRDEALSVLHPIAQQRRCEIGHHLHVWTTPPFQNEGPNGVDRDWVHAFQFQLPDSLFAEKAEALRAAIARNFGRSPTSHRAGRWGIDQRTVDWLAETGFTVETSMRFGTRLRQFPANVKLTTSQGQLVACTQFENHKNPYIWSSDACRSGDGSVLEVPATVDVRGGDATGMLRRCLRPGWPGEPFAFRVYRKLAQLRMLSPDPAYAPGTLPTMIDNVISRGVRVVNLMFHSSELALHCSPFTRNESDHNRVWAHLDEAFRHIRRVGIESCGISDIANIAGQAT